MALYCCRKVCISGSRNDQQYAQIGTIALFYILAPTCFGSTLPSSGSFWIRLIYMQIQIGLVVHHIMLVKWPVCQSVVVLSVVLPGWEAQWPVCTQLGTTTVRHTGHLTNIILRTTKPICISM
jgi:hypothetical protein